MSYTLLALVAVVLSLVLELSAIRSGLLTQGRFYVAYGIVLIFQLISNGYLTQTGIVQYDPAAVSGLRIVFAPIEDVLFGFALVLLIMATWVRLGQRSGKTSP
jgi:lycopene cyclase domain-containing protein